MGKFGAHRVYVEREITKWNSSETAQLCLLANLENCGLQCAPCACWLVFQCKPLYDEHHYNQSFWKSYQRLCPLECLPTGNFCLIIFHRTFPCSIRSHQRFSPFLSATPTWCSMRRNNRYAQKWFTAQIVDFSLAAPYSHVRTANFTSSCSLKS